VGEEAFARELEDGGVGRYAVGAAARASRPITRALYREWDRVPLEHDGHSIEVYVVGMPMHEGAPGTVWLEAALDGIVVLDRDGRIARHLGRVRRDIATGVRVRRRAHGQPYWTAAS
jgi:hypothetical protein